MMLAQSLTDAQPLAVRESPLPGRFIPLPRGPQWYLVAYRWLVVAAGLYSLAVTWNAWQARSGPEMALAPMLPVWDWLPQISLGWPMAGSLLLVLVRPWAGVISY